MLISQAVILCGGLGTRLRPLTNTTPKPMVLVNNHPFLFHLLSQMSNQGIKKFVLLVGYLCEKVQDYFGDGSKYGWNITYSSGPVAWETGRRLWEARQYCDKSFLLLYADNYMQFNLSKLERLHIQFGMPITLSLSKKENGNIKYSNNLVLGYDNSRNNPDHSYVEVGYMAINRDVFFSEFREHPNFPDFNLSDLLRKLASKRQLSGLVVLGGYQSISDPDRLALMTSYLTPKKILLLDRDGIINKKVAQGEYVTCWDEFELIPDSLIALKKLASDGYSFIVITNQAGVARKKMSTETLCDIHEKMTQQLESLGINILKVYTCEHHWNEGCGCRKPKPGLFYQASKDFLFRLDQVLYIGDDPRDCVASSAAGSKSVFIGSKGECKGLSGDEYPIIISAKMTDALEYIFNFYNHTNDNIKNSISY
jgi:D-glycero-D-manno-heptose 1,7-bisphosphate phosphatase